MYNTLVPNVLKNAEFLTVFNNSTVVRKFLVFRPNLKSVALPITEIIAGTLQLWEVSGYAVQGHPRSLILVPIEIAYATSY